MNPATGERFGPYEILGTLGRGGVGEVYRAWDARLEREVALKVLHEDYPQHGNRERFLLEARAASALSHANICTIFDMGQKEGAPYLVMELLKGVTLKQRIERSGLGAEELIRIAAEIAEALGAAHALGIIHRDIKPANVMLTRQPDGRTRVKVLDFGLAKLKGPLPGRFNQPEEHLTLVGEAVGTVSYMSPEQARGEDLDGRSDLFSLGVVMYEMATRRTPFHGATTALLFAQLLSKAPEPIRDWNEEIPRPVEKVILRLLEKDPARRYQSASELVDALEAVCTKLGGSRWRRSSSPAVPLVRVEEPVARAGLPARPEFLRERGSATPAEHVAAVTPGGDYRHRTPTGSPGRGEYVRLTEERDTARRSGSPAPVRLRAGGSTNREAGNARWGSDMLSPAKLESRRPAVRTPQEQTPSGHAAEPRTPPRAENTPPPVVLRRDPLPPAELPWREEDDASASSGRMDLVSRRTSETHPPAAPAMVGEPSLETSAVTDRGEAPSPNASGTVVDVAPSGDRADSGVREPVWLRASVSWAGGHFLRVADPNTLHDFGEGDSRWWKQRPLVLAAVAASLICAAGALFTVRAAGKHPAALGPADHLLVTAIENRTGVQSLDGTVAAGLELELAQTQSFAVAGVEEYRAALQGLGAQGQPVSVALARKAAAAAGAKVFAYGEIRDGDKGAHSSGAGYLLRVRVLETASGHELAAADAPAERTEEIANAIDTVSAQLRRELAPDATGASNTAAALVPLAREASGNLTALHAYSVGLDALASGHAAGALKAFGTASAADPGFVQAWIAAAWTAQEQMAETSSVQAAVHALDSSEGHSQRTALLAEIAYETMARGDLPRAAQAATRLVELAPHDPEAELALVRVLRAEGESGGAYSAAQKAMDGSPASIGLLRQGALAAIESGQPNAATDLEQHSADRGAPQPDVALLAAYLSGKEDALRAALAGIEKVTDAASAPAAHAAYLDNVGEVSEGSRVWMEAAHALRGQAGWAGADSALLARGALNRALVGDCDNALTLAHAAEPGRSARNAQQDTGVAEGLCRDPALPDTDTTSSGSLPPLARAAFALGIGETDEARRELDTAGHANAGVLALYLRGLADARTGRMPAAIEDFQGVLARRGAALAAGTDLYPAAQLGLARALAASGSGSGASQAYRAFLQLWDGAGSGDRLRQEASAGARGVFTLVPPELPVEAAAPVSVAEVRRPRPAPLASPSRPEPPPRNSVSAAARPAQAVPPPTSVEERRIPHSTPGGDLE